METMFMQNFGGKTKSIMVFLKMAYIILSPETSRFFYFFFYFSGWYTEYSVL